MGPSARAGKILQAAEDQDDADEQADEERRRGSGRCRRMAPSCVLAAIEPAIAITGTT